MLSFRMIEQYRGADSAKDTTPIVAISEALVLRGKRFAIADNPLQRPDQSLDIVHCRIYAEAEPKLEMPCAC